MAPDSLLHRIRWANVAGALVVLGCLALVLVWPRLAPRTVEPPPSLLLPARAPAAAIGSAPGEILRPPAPAAPQPGLGADAPSTRRRDGAATAREGGRGGGAPGSPRARRRRGAATPRAGGKGRATGSGSSRSRPSAPTPGRRSRAAGARPSRAFPGPRPVARPRGVPPAVPPVRSLVAPPAAPAPAPRPRHQAQREFGPAGSEFPRRR